MAVTSIWPIKGRVSSVIDYARNPEKTTEEAHEGLAALHTIDGVMEYAADEMKTERRAYVSCLNCREDTAAEQFMETKRYWDKTGGRVCYHGYQSFRADEVTAEIAHEIGVKLAEELWGDRFEVLVATHCNTGHYHTHFVINANKTDMNKTDSSETNLSFPSPLPAGKSTRGPRKRQRQIRMDEIDLFRRRVRENIDYDILIADRPSDQEVIDGYVELMVDVCCSPEEYTCILHIS